MPTDSSVDISSTPVKRQCTSQTKLNIGTRASYTWWLQGRVEMKKEERIETKPPKKFRSCLPLWWWVGNEYPQVEERRRLRAESHSSGLLKLRKKQTHDGLFKYAKTVHFNSLSTNAAANRVNCNLWTIVGSEDSLAWGDLPKSCKHEGIKNFMYQRCNQNDGETRTERERERERWRQNGGGGGQGGVSRQVQLTSCTKWNPKRSGFRV